VEVPGRISDKEHNNVPHPSSVIDTEIRNVAIPFIPAVSRKEWHYSMEYIHSDEEGQGFLSGTQNDGFA
jgi:hypothetical protein